MSKGDREGFIVKFVESKEQKTEHAVKAYEVYDYLTQIYYWWCISFFATALLLMMTFVCLMFTQAILELQSEKYLKTVNEDAILQMDQKDQKDKSLFVFSSFTTPAFLHCKNVWLSLWYVESLEFPKNWWNSWSHEE